MNTLALVACVARKLDRPAPAKELYTSPWFRLARAYVEAQGWPWRILSAEWGLLDPERWTEPYDLTLATMSRERRQGWAQWVLQSPDLYAPGWNQERRTVILAGRLYRADIESVLRQERGHTVETPLAGLGIGQQLKWFKEHTK